MIRAAIDIGTNSIKLCAAYVDGASVKVIKDVCEITKLGSGMREGGSITQDAMSVSAACIKKYVNEARSLGAESIIAAGTMALRNAKNSEDFIRRVKEETGLDVRVISGEDEAVLSFKAAISSLPQALTGRVVTFDTGGGSTEFVFGENGRITYKKSVEIGGVTLTEDYFPSSPVAHAALVSAQELIKEKIKGEGISANGVSLIGMGGNITSMAAVKLGLEEYDASLVHGMRLSASEVRSQIELYAARTVEERRTIKGLSPDRAGVILAGACIVCAAMELCGASDVTVCDRGLRHMLLME